MARTQKRTKSPMSAQHKEALAVGREQGRAVRRYLEALEANRPKRGRKRTTDSVKRQSDHVPRLVGDPRDVVDRAVGVVAVAGNDAVIGTKLGERLRLADVISLEVIDGKPEH